MKDNLLKLNCQLSSLTRANRYLETLKLFYQIHSSHLLRPDHYSLSSAVSSAAHRRDSAAGAQLHCHSLKSGIFSHRHVANTFLDFYSKVRVLGDVKRVFGEVRCPDVYSWTTLLSACAKLGDIGFVIRVFDGVSEEGTECGEIMYACKVFDGVVGKRTECGEFEYACKVFDGIPKKRTECGEFDYACKVFDGIVGERAECVEFEYACKVFDGIPENRTKCGEIEYACKVFDGIPEKRTKCEEFEYAPKVFDEIPKMRTECVQIVYARKVFDEIPERSTAVWNAAITGCAENRYACVAFDLFKRMHKLGVSHDNYTFASVLSLCEATMVDFGKQVHSLAIRTGFFARASVINALITMYFVCGRGMDAYRVFEEAEMFDEITYNSMIAGLVRTGKDEEALMMYSEMLEVSLRPTELTFVSVMSSCSRVRIGFQLHVQVIKMGFDMYTSVGNAAITMYSNCGDIYSACFIFERLREKDLVTWNTMISCYAQENLWEAAILVYLRMQNSGIDPDEFTFGSLLASSESPEDVKMVQPVIIKNGLIVKVEVSNALISSFARHGNIIQAYDLFEGISSKNLISWNTILSGLQLNGFPMQGVEQFSAMLSSGIKPNTYTLGIILSICADMSSLKHGKEVHGYVLRQGFSSETSLGNSLITIYAKIGILDWSLRVFNTMVFKDTVSWNSLISAYAQHGKGKHALSCFDTMILSCGSQPDQATFTSVLSACSHAGLVEDGLRIFNSMVNYYDFEPKGDHFSCIVDLLSRAGYLDEAERLVNGENFKFDNNPWWALFSACVGYGDVRLGRIVGRILLENEENDPAVYVQLSNIYSAAGQWEEAANVRKMMDRLGVSKTYGYSWIR